MDDEKKKKGMSVAIVLGGGGPSKKSSESKEPEEESDDTEDGLELDEDQLEAFKEFEGASSTEDKAKALKAFIKMCGGYS